MSVRTSIRTLLPRFSPGGTRHTTQLLIAGLAAAHVLVGGASSQASAQTLATYGLTSGWATFGLALPQGAATSGVQVGSLPTQVDVKTRWSDGSIRFAVVTARVSSTGSYAIAPAAASIGNVSANWPAASVRLIIGGVTYTADMPSPGADTWLSGPLVVERRALVAPATSTGMTHAFLRVLYDVRVYSDGAYRVDVAVQNTLDVASADRITYDVAVSVGGVQKYAKTSVVHPYMMRWRKVFGGNGLTESAVTPDFQPMYAAQALPRILSSVGDTSYTVGTTGYDILEAGSLSRVMSATGGRAEIGPYPDWTGEYMVYRRAEVRKYVLRHGDLAGSWSVHITKPDGFSLISIDERPEFMLHSYANTGNKPANNLAGIGFIEGTTTYQLADNAHQPSLAYVPYLLTGDRYYADEMAFWANYVLLSQPPADDARRLSEGLLQLDQPRGIAWGLRTLVDAAAYLPDAHPMKTYFASKVANNLRWADDYAATHATPLATSFEFGWGGGPQRLISGQWQNNYIAWSLVHANRQGFAGGIALVDRIVKLQLLLFSSSEWPREGAAPYYLVTGVRYDGQAPQYYTRLRDVYNATASYYGAGDGGFPSFASAYGIDARFSLLIAGARGLAGATEALTYLMAQPGMVGYVNSRPGWAIDAASLSASAAPITTGGTIKKTGPRPPRNVHVVK